MARKKISKEEKENHEKEQKMRAAMSRSARRSGKITTKEGKVNKSTAKTNTPRSQKKGAAIKKSRY